MNSKRKNPRSIRLNTALEAAIESRARKVYRSFSWVVSAALSEYLQRQGGVELEQEGDRTEEKVLLLEQQIAAMQRQIETLNMKPKLVLTQEAVEAPTKVDRNAQARQNYLESVKRAQVTSVQQRRSMICSRMQMSEIIWKNCWRCPLLGPPLFCLCSRRLRRA